MENTDNPKPVKASPAKPNIKSLPGDKTLGLDPYIHFYEIEGGDITEEGSEAEILFIHD